jgi:amino acid adenylation domain-containing protein
MSFLRMIFNEDRLAAAFPGCVTHIQTAGERVTVNQRFGSYLRQNQVVLHNHYGPTESHVVTTFSVDPGGEIPGAPHPGKPIGNVGIYILEPDAPRLLPVGIVGEIYIGGVCLARGYLNRPELTCERFINYKLQNTNYKQITSSKLQITNTCTAKTLTLNTSTLYKTGDLARWLPDGNIELLGRSDHQVKVRGFRIELGEIEHQLLTHGKIKEAVVMAREDDNNKELCAYLVVKPGEINPIAEPGLRDYLANRLPDYMVPAYFVQLDHIPLTPNGKIDRNALPGPKTKTGKNYIAPRNEIEKKLADLWSEILGVEKKKISINDNFFHLGGHSLKATVLAARLHKQLDINVPLAEIFKTPHLHGLAAYIKAAAGSKHIPVEPVEKKEYYPLSSVQRRLYIIQQMDAEKGTAYNMPSVWQLQGELDKGKMAGVFQRLIRRHEGLRTFFTEVNDEPVQRIHEENYKLQITKYKQNTNHKLQIPNKDAPDEGCGAPSRLDAFGENLAAEDTGCRAKEPFEAENQELSINSYTKDFIRPFDLSQAPLLRVGLIESNEQRHILMVDLHHIISDGLSSEIFIREFTGLYSGKRLPPLRLQYKDYGQWHKKHAGRAFLKEQETYWLKQFAGEVPVLDMPADYLRPSLQSFAGQTLCFEINREETAALKSLALQRDVTLFMFLLLLYTVFLGKLSNQEDLVVGTPLAGRRHTDLEGIIGMFVNTLALRNILVVEKTLGQLLGEIKENTIKAFENQDYLYEDLVEKVAGERDTGRNPLFDAMFALRHSDALEIEIPGLHVQPVDYETQRSKFDLTLTAVEVEEKLVFSFEYCTELFKEETIRRFAGFFQKIVITSLGNLDIRISELEIINTQEKHRLLYELNDTESEEPRNKTIPQLFAEQVERTPDHAALASNGQLLTYRELNNKANRLAYWLIETGTLADSIVAIMVKRSLEMIIGILGILKSGGAYLPLDPDYPEERIAYMLKDSNAKLLVTTGNLTKKDEKVGKWEGEIYNIEECLCSSYPLTFSPSYLQNTSPSYLQNSSTLAYIIYTSGTTGKPKGTLTSHANVIRVVRNSNYLDITAYDRLLQLSNYAFDGSVFDIYGALTNGAVLSLLKAEEIIDVDRLAGIITKQAITCFFVTTALFNTIVDLAVECLQGVRKILFGGERVSVAHVRKALAYLGQGRIIHVYGPTETTVYAAYYEIRQVEDKARTIPLGSPLTNTSVYILDKACKPVPIMVSGEIYIGGDGVARGYLNNPELTAEKFCLRRPGGALFEKTAPPGPPGKNVLLDPLLTRATNTSTLYKTGDLGRWLPEGSIEFLGRKDHQVKIRGFRIELGEIEKQLLKHQGINEAVVIDREDFAGNKYLCAYIVPGSANTGDENQLREFLSMSLPHYMIPSSFVFLERIPLTGSGKIDRKALPEPEMTGMTEYMPPRNEVETKLVEIWSGVLGREVGINNNFFHVGGDSIKAILIASRLKKHGLNLKITDLFLHPVIDELAKFVKTIQPGIDRTTEVGCRELSPGKLARLTDYIRDNIPGNPAMEAVYPLTPMQKTMLYHSLSGKNKEVFFIQYLFHWHGAIENSILESSLDKLVQRHDIFRTIFIYEDLDEPLQIVLKHRKMEFNYEDMAHWQEEEKTRHLEKCREKDIKRGFDLGKDILVRVTLFRVDVNSYYLMWSNHYILLDGWCVQIVFNQLYQIYEGLKKGKPIELEEVSPYGNYIRWLENQDKSAGFRYWRNYLAGYEHRGDLVPTKPGKPLNDSENNFKE